jgi:uncharacterized protein (DUF305 family)
MKGGEHMKTRTIIVPVLAAGIVTVGLLYGGPVHAQSTTPTQTETRANFFQGLVDKLASTFNLDKARVQTVVEEYHEQNHAERQAEMQKRQEERLNTLVTEGKITEAQKQAIIAKTAELKRNFDPAAMRNMTKEQRKAAMEQKRTELESWAQSQGIDPQYILGMGRGMNGMRGERNGQ